MIFLMFTTHNGEVFHLLIAYCVKNHHLILFDVMANRSIWDHPVLLAAGTVNIIMGKQNKMFHNLWFQKNMTGSNFFFSFIDSKTAALLKLCKKSKIYADSSKT